MWEQHPHSCEKGKRPERTESWAIVRREERKWQKGGEGKYQWK